MKSKKGGSHEKKNFVCTAECSNAVQVHLICFAAETQPVKTERHQTKEALPFTITEANNDIKDEVAKSWSSDHGYGKCKGCCRLSGLVVVRAKKTPEYDSQIFI